MSGSYGIRPLERDDTLELLRFYRSLPPWVVHWYDPFPGIDEERIATHIGQVAAGHAVSYVLCAPDDAIHGHAFVLAIDGDAPVFGIGLCEAAIGRGHGRALMHRVIDDVDDRGTPVVTLTVFRDNERARRLYETFGFFCTGDASCRSPGDSFAMRRLRP